MGLLTSSNIFNANDLAKEIMRIRGRDPEDQYNGVINSHLSLIEFIPRGSDNVFDDFICF